MRCLIIFADSLGAAQAVAVPLLKHANAGRLLRGGLGSGGGDGGGDAADNDNGGAASDSANPIQLAWVPPAEQTEFAAFFAGAAASKPGAPAPRGASASGRPALVLLQAGTGEVGAECLTDSQPMPFAALVVMLTLLAD